MVHGMPPPASQFHGSLAVALGGGDPGCAWASLRSLCKGGNDEAVHRRIIHVTRLVAHEYGTSDPSAWVKAG